MSNEKFDAAFHQGQDDPENPSRIHYGPPPENLVPPGPAKKPGLALPVKAMLIVLAVLAGLGVLLCAAGMAITALAGSDGEKAAAPATSPGWEVADGNGRTLGTYPTTEPTTVAPTTEPPAPVKAPPATIEDGLYHVGEDIKPGTYRLAEPVDNSDFCYWGKFKDAEGENIIDNDLASTGRLQVTLKAGQWFETNRCGTWVKK